VAAIDALADEPRPSGCKKLAGQIDRYRVRAAGTYRIVYEIHDDRLIVVVIRVGATGATCIRDCRLEETSPSGTGVPASGRQARAQALEPVTDLPERGPSLDVTPVEGASRAGLRAENGADVLAVPWTVGEELVDDEILR
jgi:ParE toxin of type II toxin-antitoxin system, parDE